MCFFAVTGGTVTVIVFYHGNGLHGDYRSFTAVKIPRGNLRGKPSFFQVLFFSVFTVIEAYKRHQISSGTRLANEKGGRTDLSRRWPISGLHLT